MGGGPTTSSGDAAGIGAGTMGGEDRVESLADILARADDGPGNLKETFRLVGAFVFSLRCAEQAFFCVVSALFWW